MTAKEPSLIAKGTVPMTGVVKGTVPMTTFICYYRSSICKTCDTVGQGKEKFTMKEIIREVNALIAEMDSAGKFDDDIFISFFEREEELQERLDEQKKENALSQEEWKDCSDRLGEAFGRLKGKLSFCNLH